MNTLLLLLETNSRLKMRLAERGHIIHLPWDDQDYKDGTVVSRVECHVSVGKFVTVPRVRETDRTAFRHN